MDDIVNTNICISSDDGLDSSWSPKRCDTILSGGLTQGLSNALSKWHNILSLFKELNYIETKSGADLFYVQLDQAYISVTLTNYTLSMRNLIKSSLSSNT